MTVETISVLGAGAFGTALAMTLAEASASGSVTLWGRDAPAMEAMARDRVNARRLPGLRFPDALVPTHDMALATEADIVLLAVPTQKLRAVLETLKTRLQRPTPPVLGKFCDHTAAVKAMAWSPHQHGLLVSGGGTADRTIKFRNTLTGSTIKTLDAGSQVCNLMFSKTVNEIVSTHGYSQNEINIWKYPKMDKIATLTGHTYRVLYLAMSPDGSTIVTGAGDETLRFWNVFPTREETGKKRQSMLQVENIMLR